MAKKKKLATTRKEIRQAKKAKKSVRMKTMLGSEVTWNPSNLGSYKRKKKSKKSGADAGYRGVNANSASYNRKKKK